MNTKLRAIEHRAISGIWLLGDDFEEIIISEETYNWLWKNIYTICDHPRLVKMFWSNSSQYFDFKLQSVQSNYDFQIRKVVNQKQIDARNNERDRFLEFHYALGGLLLFRGQYQTLKYMFEYTQSLPPRYVLLPETMTQIFRWFENFGNEFKHQTPIDFKYYFPELDNLGNSRQINYWICSYITILFLRQYSLSKYYINQDFTALPDLPSDILVLGSWLDNVSFFEKCLNDVLSNEKLIEELNFKKLIEENKEEFPVFVNNLKKEIKNKIGHQKLNAELSNEKITNFYERSNEIISEAFKLFQPIFRSKDNYHQSSELKLRINGEQTLISKSAFTDNDVPNLNYDSILAGWIASNKIKRLIPNSFLIARTKRYLFNKANILNALMKLTTNDEVIIVGVNLSYDITEILKESNFKNKIIYIPSTEYQTQDTVFVLERNNLPAIEYEPINEEEITNNKLQILNKELNLYASVIDINKEENYEIKKKWDIETDSDDLDLKVQIMIAFKCVIYWKNNREVIQINVASEFREQGIQNDINDIESHFNSKKS